MLGNQGRHRTGRSPVIFVMERYAMKGVALTSSYGASLYNLRNGTTNMLGNKGRHRTGRSPTIFVTEQYAMDKGP